MKSVAQWLFRLLRGSSDVTGRAVGQAVTASQCRGVFYREELFFLVPTAVSPACQPCFWALPTRSPSQPSSPWLAGGRQLSWRVHGEGTWNHAAVGATDRGWVGTVTGLPQGRAAGMNFPLVSGQI